VHDDIESVLFSEERIHRELDRLAADVTAAYRGRELTVVAVLKGSCVFVADLIRRLPLPLELAFVSAVSYRSGTAPGRLELGSLPPADEVRGRSVLLVDDILDTGRTLEALLAEIRGRGARDVRTCVFLDKPARRAAGLRPDFSCFRVDDVFVVGYGLDFAGRYRNLPFVGTLKPDVVAAGRGR